MRDYVAVEAEQNVWVIAGQGNNGADALAVARMLLEQGYNVQVLLFNVFGRLSEGCIHSRKRLLDAGNVNFTEVTGDFNPPFISPDSLVIDGLFGSGLREPLTGGFRSFVDYINESKATIVSIDVPSGLMAEWNEDTLRRNVIHAHLTLALQFPRVAFSSPIMQSFSESGKCLTLNLASRRPVIRSRAFSFLRRTMPNVCFAIAAASRRRPTMDRL